MKSQILRFSETCFVDFFFSLPFFPFWRGPCVWCQVRIHLNEFAGIKTEVEGHQAALRKEIPTNPFVLYSVYKHKLTVSKILRQCCQSGLRRGHS